MSRDVCEIVKKMDIKAVETQLAIQCAPFIMGLKLSNMFTINSNKMPALNRVLEKLNISYIILKENNGKIMLFLYDRYELCCYMSNAIVQHTLKKLGYKQFDVEYLLCRFKERYSSYMDTKQKFPHELGFFLGYPVEDVLGYLDNNGENSLFTGYWKVYSDVEGKQKLFRSYEMATETLIRNMHLLCG